MSEESILTKGSPSHHPEDLEFYSRGRPNDSSRPLATASAAASSSSPARPRSAPPPRSTRLTEIAACVLMVTPSLGLGVT